MTDFRSKKYIIYKFIIIIKTILSFITILLSYNEMYVLCVNATQKRKKIKLSSKKKFVQFYLKTK